MEKLTDQFVLPKGQLRDAVVEMEEKFQTAWNLLNAVRGYIIIAPDDGDKVEEELRRKVDEFLFPPGPVLLNVELDEKTFRLKVWLNRGEAQVPLTAGTHYYIDPVNGRVQLMNTMDNIWEVAREVPK